MAVVAAAACDRTSGFVSPLSPYCLYKGDTIGLLKGRDAAGVVTPDPTLGTVMLLCARRSGASLPGDSGGPVYYWKAPLLSDWRIPEGIEFGSGYKSTTNTEYMLYTTWSQIEGELGVTMDPSHP